MIDNRFLRHLVAILVLMCGAWGVGWAQEEDDEFEEDGGEEQTEITTADDGQVGQIAYGSSTNNLSVFNPYSWFPYSNGLFNWLSGECNSVMYNNMAVNGADQQTIDAVKKQLGCNNHKNQFAWLGASLSLFTLFVSLFFVLLYYLIIDSSKLYSYLWWGLFGLLNGVVGALIAVGMCYDAKTSCWLYSYDPIQSELSLFGSISILPIVVANSLISMLWFGLMSGLLKRISKNCSNIPWPTKLLNVR